MARTRLRNIAVCRGGDKWANLYVAMHVLDPKFYESVKEQVTPQRVKEFFGNEVAEVERYELPNVCGLTFVLHDALDGGIPRSLQFDRRSTFAEALMDLEIDTP